jgi:hypothetical protein
VLATPVGIAPEVLAAVPGTYCAPYGADAWREALRGVLDQPDPRVAGRAVAERYSAERTARRVYEAWRGLV